MNPKYELTNETITVRQKTLYRIRALRSFSDVKEGDLGGYVESESNLSQFDNCWIYDEAKVFGDARVLHNATVHMNAQVYDQAQINDDAFISKNASVCQRALVSGHATITDAAIVSGDAVIHGNAFVGNSAFVDDKAHIRGNAQILKYAIVNGYANITEDAVVESMKDYMVFQNNWLSGEPLKKLLFITVIIIIMAFILIYYLTSLSNQVTTYTNIKLVINIIKYAVILSLGGYMLLFVGFVINLFVQQWKNLKEIYKNKQNNKFL